MGNNWRLIGGSLDGAWTCSLRFIATACLLAGCATATNGDRTVDAGTLIPSPVPTRTPRPTATPTIAPSATPDVPLYDDGAWLLFRGEAPDDERNSHLWAVNWDGTGLTDLLPDLYVYQYKVQPSVDGSPGRYMAAITSYGWSDKFMFTLAHLPDGEVIANIPLTNPQTELVDWVRLGDPNYDDYIRRETSSMSISDLRSLAWSPDGTQIAFSGAQNGTQTEVYRYSLTDGTISRLTWSQHPHHASNLLWSPDGRYVAYDDISMWSTGFYRVDGVWMVRMDGSMVRRIASIDEWPPLDEWESRPQKLGWTSDHTIAVYGLQISSLARYLLKQIDVDTGRSSTVVDWRFCGAAFVPGQDVWFVETLDDTDESYRERAYMIRNGITNEVEQPACCWPIWSPELNAFISKRGLVETDGEQTILDLPKSLPLVSPNGAYWAYPKGYANLEPEEKGIVTSEDVLWIGETGKQPHKLADARFEVLQWSSNSRSVLVTDTEKGLQYIAIAPDFELRLISEYNTNQYFGPWWDGKAIDD